MVSTRNNNNTQVKKKDLAKNLSQSINKASKTPTTTGKCVKSGSDTPGPSSSADLISKPYDCSICRNTETISNAALDSNTDSLLSKLNNANDAFSDSMSKVESLSLNLRHFIVSNSDEAESNQTTLSNLQTSLSDLTNRSQILHDHILKNEATLKAPAASINDLKNSTFAPSSSESLYSGHKENTCKDLLIGDSNTHKIYFNHEEGRRSDLGKEIFGRRMTAYTIEDIQPIDAIGFQNIVIQVGLNNMKDRYAPSDGLLDIEGIFSQWLKKILQIRALCPYSRIIVAPIPPTKIKMLNNRAKTFNAILFGCVNKFWYELGFDSFLDDHYDLLDNNYGRYFKVENGRPDRIHFGRLGISKLSFMIREAILSSRYRVGRQSYASVASIHITPSFPNNT